VAFGFVASLGAAAAGSCCALPLALASVGVGGAWLGNLGTLTPYRPYLLGAAMVGLGVAWMTTLRRARRRTCETAPACRRAPARRWTFAVLAASTLLVLFAASSNWLEPLIVDALLDAGGKS
jgi:mercuric ion transport protein